MKPAATLAVALLLASCSPGQPVFPPGTVTEPAWPTLAACLEATRGTLAGPGSANGTCARIDFENMLSPMFVLRELIIEIDGTLLFALQEPTSGRRGQLSDARAFTAFLGQAAVGEHEVRLAAWLLPNPTIQPSLLGYRWRVCSKHYFTLTHGGGFDLRAILYERRGGQRPPHEWPSARYVENSDTRVPVDDARRYVPYEGLCPRTAPK